MTGRAVCLILLFCVTLTASHVPGTARRSLSRMVGQQPLLFGRRGINPNMNSLFFGKRALSPTPSSPPVSLDDLSAACNALISTYRQLMVNDNNDS